MCWTYDNIDFLFADTTGFSSKLLWRDTKLLGEIYLQQPINQIWWHIFNEFLNQVQRFKFEA